MLKISSSDNSLLQECWEYTAISLPWNTLLIVDPCTRPSICTEYQPEEHESVEPLRMWKGRSSENNGCWPRLLPGRGSSPSACFGWKGCRKELLLGSSFASYLSPLTTFLTTISNPAKRIPRLYEPNLIRISNLDTQDIIVLFLTVNRIFRAGYRETRSYSQIRILNENGALAENFTGPVWLEHE